jgi:N-acetylmuramic acid 6-phosphate etherase
LVRGIIAGGSRALTRSQEGAEDDVEAGFAAVDALAAGRADVVVGVAASGTTPYVIAAIARARDRGARTVFVTCADPPARMAELCDELVVAKVGPEALTGSTRLKAGTATKMILNTISTGAMIRSGKAYGNLMVDLIGLSDKLVDRGERIVMEACSVDRKSARNAILAAHGSVKVAIVMQKLSVSSAEAQHMLRQNDGRVRFIVGDPPPV